MVQLSNVKSMVVPAIGMIQLMMNEYVMTIEENEKSDTIKGNIDVGMSTWMYRHNWEECTTSQGKWRENNN